MTSPYILKFSDPTNTNSITILPVPQGPGVDIDSTSLALVGSGYKNYGLPTAQNFLKLLENFASPNQPLHPVKGQLWYDIANPNKPVLRINNGKLTSARWPSASGIYQQTDDPQAQFTDSIAEGDIWVDTANNQLKIRFSNSWTTVGPTLQTGINKSGTEAAFVESTTAQTYPVIKNWVDGKIVEIISYYAFTPRSVIDGFSTIKLGVNLTSKIVAKYNGLSERASALELSPGKLINASEVLKNNATSQTITGLINIQSTNGLNIAPNATSNPINIYSDLTNSAYINFSNTYTAATFKIGINLGYPASTYLKFNSTYSSIGINKSPVSNSPALDVEGGAKFTKLVTINTNTLVALSVVGGAEFGGNVTASSLLISGQTTATGKLSLGSISGDGAIIEPTTSTQYDIGSLSKKFRDIYASSIYATTFNGSVTGSATSLSARRAFKVQGQVTATTVFFNGTDTTTFDTTLTRTSIDGQTITETPVATHTLLVLNTATTTSSLEKISKKSFLSDIYPNIFQTGMIVPFGTSTNIPSGFLVCNGVAQTITSYPALYAIIGTSYGGSGATFRVPNLSTSTPVGGGYLTYIIKT